MTINDRIKSILVDKNISPSHFADEIGVQRSSISHILAGRNRPSLDIVQKIIKRYPELGLEWILEDNRDEEPSKPVYASKSSSYPPSTSRNKRGGSTVDFNRKKQPELWDVQSNVSAKANPVVVASEPKSIERILIFYSDGTFREFKPE